MKFLHCIFFVFLTSTAFAQSDLKFNDSWFGDNITYKDDLGKEQKMGVSVYKVDDTPRNTVIYLHGCGGVSRGYVSTWIKRFKEWGYNTVVIDSYRYRWVGYACSNAEYLAKRPYDRVHDLHAIAMWIADQPWNKGKPSAVGFSHGAMVLHIASSSQYSKKSKSLLSSGSAFYPFCHYDVTTDWAQEWPFQMHIGDKDDFGPPWLCQGHERFQADTFDYNLYQDAYHGWDMGMSETMNVIGVGGTVKPRTIRPNAEVDRISAEKTRLWISKFF